MLIRTHGSTVGVLQGLQRSADPRLRLVKVELEHTDPVSREVVLEHVPVGPELESGDKLLSRNDLADNTVEFDPSSNKLGPDGRLNEAYQFFPCLGVFKLKLQQKPRP